jgi:Mrp family chromosome partitioning ATPase
MGVALSKIMAAMAKGAHGERDLVYNLETMGDAALFPQPARIQMAQFERLADTLINLSRREPGHGSAVVFSSTLRGEGCSFVSYNVARHLSLMLDSKVAWVDGNFISPQRKLTGKGVGFRDLLKDPSRIEEVASGPNFVTIPHGEGEIKQTQLLSSGRYDKLIDAMCKTFHFTIIDAPAVNESVDVGRFARPTMGVVLVVESRRLKYEVVQHSIDSIRSQDGTVLGTVLNRQSYDIPDFLYRRFLGV